MSIVRACGLVLALVLVAGCTSSDSPPSAGERCRLTASSNACLRCQAQKCSTQFDYCFGAGFHRGDLVSIQEANRAVACYDFSACVQTCGCHDQCFRTCNDELRAGCGMCREKYFDPCLKESCGAECGFSPDGGA